MKSCSVNICKLIIRVIFRVTTLDRTKSRKCNIDVPSFINARTLNARMLKCGFSDTKIFFHFNLKLLKSRES